MQMKMKNVLKRTIVATTLGMFATGASAALQTLSGDGFDLTYDDAALGFYGAPTLIGSLISFTPTSYFAKSENGVPAAALDLQNSTINLRLTPHAGLQFTSIGLSEGGDYLMLGASSFVGVTGQTRAYDLAQPPATQIVTPISGMLNIINTLPNVDTHNWSFTNTTNLGAAYANTQDLSYTIQNLLLAYTEPSDMGPKLAFVEKKFVSLDVSVTPIPEAETWAMMLIGVGLVGFQLRRKSKQQALHRFV